MSALTNILRGTPKFKSILGLSTCEGLSFGILAGFITICVLMTVYNLKANFREQQLKQKYGKLHKSEEYLQPKRIPYLLILAFLSAFIG